MSELINEGNLLNTASTDIERLGYNTPATYDALQDQIIELQEENAQLRENLLQLSAATIKRDFNYTNKSYSQGTGESIPLNISGYEIDSIAIVNGSGSNFGAFFCSAGGGYVYIRALQALSNISFTVRVKLSKIS